MIILHKKSTIRLAGISLISVVIPFVCVAQQSQKGIPAGSGTFYPGLELGLSHDDNLLRTIEGSELETWIYSVSPYLAYELKDNTRRFMVDWRLDAGFHDDSGTDDYLDNTIGAVLEFQPTNRFFAGISGEYKDTRDPRGTARAEGLAIGRILRDPDEWHHFKVEGSMAYGLESARARLEGDVGYITKEYDNNRTLTAIRDHDDTFAAGRLFYRLAPKTSLVVEGRITDYEYQTTPVLGSTLDSVNYQIFGGVTWEALNKTTGTVKFGYIDKDFDSAVRGDSDAFNWEVEVVWTPRSYSVVTLSTSREFDETNGAGNLIESDIYSANWTHHWRDHISSTVEFTYINDTFQPTTREDDLLNIGLRLNYDVRNWLTLSAGYSYDERDSNRNAFDYERNLFLVTADIYF